MHAENTILIQFLQAALGVLLVASSIGCKTPQAITHDTPIDRHDQEMPSVTIQTNFPSPRALLRGDNGKYPNRKYPIYLEQEDSIGDFLMGIGGIIRLFDLVNVAYGVSH